MVAAFFKSGLEPWLITISDLMDRRANVRDFSGLVFCGGFSFGVPGNLPFVISQGESSAGVSIRFALCDIFAHSIHLRFDDLRAADPFFLL